MSDDLDNLMGIVTAEEKKRLRAELDQERRSQEQTKAELRALHELVESDGWKLFQRDAEAYEGAVLTRMAACTDPTSLAKMAGAMLELRARRTWARERISALTEPVS